MNELKYLEWDSNFFGFKVGLLSSVGTLNKLNAQLDKYQKDGYRLIYLVLSQRINETFLNKNNRECFFMDEKITFIKKIEKNKNTNSNILKYAGNNSDELLYELAIQSGEYSRFKLDKNIEDEKFRQLYILWMTNSINKVIANEVFVVDKKNVRGVVTLGEKNKRANIGLIAVNKECRGEGLGKQLLVAAENWGSSQGYKHIQVVTQKHNKIACSFYESNGYHQEKNQFIYHVWFDKINL